MAVETTDIQSLLKNVDLKSILGDTGMAETTGGLGIGGGVLGAVLVGALLPRLLGDQNGLNAGAAAATMNQTAEKAAIDAAVASALASANQANNNSMLLLKDIQDTGQDLTSTITTGFQTNLVNQLQGQISNMQGQASILAGVESAKGSITNEVHESSVDTMAGLNSLAAGVASGFSALNTNVLQGTYATTQAINNDGDKTRALIQSISTADLNRQIIVAQNEATELRHEGRIRDSGVTVTNNINQNAIATANATAQQQIVGLLGQVTQAIQHNTQSTVNLGTMIGSGQTATNVRS